MIRCTDCELLYRVVWEDDDAGDPTACCPRCGGDCLEIGFTTITGITDAELKLLLRQAAKLKGYGPLTAAEADAAYDAADAVPMSAEEIERIVKYVTGH